MGYLANPTPEMGDLCVEVRSESFLIGGSDEALPYVYAHSDEPCPRGSVEFSLRAIPNLRALLDQAERVASGNKRLGE